MDFSHADELIAGGYASATEHLDAVAAGRASAARPALLHA
jgi:hypothetical protein